MRLDDESELIQESRMFGLTRVAEFFDDDQSRIDAANQIELSEE